MHDKDLAIDTVMCNYHAYSKEDNQLDSSFFSNLA